MRSANDPTPWHGRKRRPMMLSLVKMPSRTTRRRRFSGLRASARESASPEASRARQDVHALVSSGGKKSRAAVPTGAAALSRLKSILRRHGCTDPRARSAALAVERVVPLPATLSADC